MWPGDQGHDYLTGACEANLLLIYVDNGGHFFMNIGHYFP